MSNGPFSAIVSDIDGTLLTRVNDQISERLKAAVAEVTSRGIPFSLSTGRMRRSAWKVHREIGANATMICYQGAMAVDAETNTLLRHERLDESTAFAAIEFSRDEGWISGFMSMTMSLFRTRTRRILTTRSVTTRRW